MRTPNQKKHKTQAEPQASEAEPAKPKGRKAKRKASPKAKSTKAGAGARASKSAKGEPAGGAGGRPRSSGSTLPIYDSMQQASAQAHIPLSLLKQAKRAGCEAFKWNRVDLAKFLEWTFKQGSEESSIDWGSEFKKWQAKREKIRHDRDERMTVSRDEVREAISGQVAALFGEMDRRFCTELPPSLKGREETHIRDKCQSEIEELKAHLRSKFDEIARDE